MTLSYVRLMGLPATRYSLAFTELQSDDWSDDEDAAQNSETPSDISSAMRRIRALENALHKAQQDLVDYRSFVGDRLNLAGLAEALQDPASSSSTHVSVPLRDDDSHYFQSYGENGLYILFNPPMELD